VRAAFGILEREFLVTMVPGKGVYVRALADDSIRALFAVRRLLESYAAEAAAQRVAANPQQAEDLETAVSRFEEVVREGRTEDYAERDLDIHRAVWALTGNEYLRDLLGRVSILAHAILGLHAEISDDWAAGAPATHRKMVKAIITGDPQVAGQVVREQLTGAEEGALSALKTIRANAHSL
jgi:DNA-binding GntR family transcriptional regulator